MIQSYGPHLALSTTTRAAYITADVEANNEPALNDNSLAAGDISPWGAGNTMPEVIADDIRNCGVLAAALDAKARIGNGKGIEPFLLYDIVEGKEELEWVDDSEIHDFLEDNDVFEYGYNSSFDKHSYGWSSGRLITDLKGVKIAKVVRDDVYKCRLGVMDQNSIISDVYMSANWGKAGLKYDESKHLKTTLLREGYERQLMTEIMKGKPSAKEFAFINRSLRDGNHYYPTPAYRSGKAWIKIARSVPAFISALFKNQISLKYIIVIHPKYYEDQYTAVKWTNMPAEEKQLIVDKHRQGIDSWLTGEDNAMKSMLTGGFYDKVTGTFTPYVDVKTLDDKIQDGKYLPESGAANSEILFALMINPALMGAGNPGGKAYGDTSGGSNVRESFLVQIMIMEAERRLNSSVFNVIKKINGWSDRLEKVKTFSAASGMGKSKKPRLVFRNPTGLLTTLDTGKSTKTETA